MSLMQRLRLIFSAKASKALDRAEDPNETLDYSYQKMLEMQQKVRRGVADVATSRKRLELQMKQLQQGSDKLTNQAQQALGQGREDLAREALTRKSGLAGQLARPPGPARPAPGRGGEAHPRLAAAAGQDRGVPHQEGDAQGDLQRRQGRPRASTRRSPGISEEMGDVGLAIERAEDKTAQMQARSGAIDELIASGALEDKLAARGRRRHRPRARGACPRPPTWRPSWPR